MRETLAIPPRVARPGNRAGRRGSPRRLLTSSAVGLLTAAALLLTPALASADTASSLTVIGTSDVSDSGLIPNLIQPAFQNAFPQFTFKYTGSATGLAIQNAMNGTGGPSALIVHAASLENQFVAGGFSLNNQFGNAIFTNDFILAGPASNETAHANVAATAPHNIAQAFAAVAAAGNSTKATFESRGGAANAPGTTVAEHGIWALVDSSGLAAQTPGLLLCSVSAADGGGETPIADPNTRGVTANGQPCPDGGTVDGTGGDLPGWYKINSGNQAANVSVANACTTAPSGPGSCYVLTDRGTFDFLSAGGTLTVGPSTIPNLAIVTRDNSATAPGGANALINYFHIYIINPSKPGQTVNVPAAQDFVNFLTSPAIQGQLKNYLAHAGDPGGAPFVADASPKITASGFKSTATGGKALTVTGSVVNAQPGFPAPSRKPVSIDELVGGLPIHVAGGVTDANGKFSIKFTPGSSSFYQVSTGQISQIEIPTLNPPYGDILSPGATTAFKMNVKAGVTIPWAKPSAGGATVAGQLLPSAPDGNARIVILARRKGSKNFGQVGGTQLKTRQTTYAIPTVLPAGKWQLQISYQDPGQLLSGTTRTVNVTVTTGVTTASFKRVSVKSGRVTVSGSLNRAPTKKGTQVKLFAFQTATGTTFRQVGTVTIKPGKKTFTVKANLKRKVRWVIQLGYAQKGKPTAYSGLRTINVN